MAHRAHFMRQGRRRVIGREYAGAASATLAGSVQPRQEVVAARPVLWPIVPGPARERSSWTSARSPALSQSTSQCSQRGWGILAHNLRQMDLSGKPLHA
jgi:hypothetical protein